VVKPLGRVHVAFGEPIQVPRRIPAEERRGYTDQVEQRLRMLDRICVRELNGEATETSNESSVAVAPAAPEATSSEQARLG
jgi:hypothetical protein